VTNWFKILGNLSYCPPLDMVAPNAVILSRSEWQPETQTISITNNIFVRKETLSLYLIMFWPEAPFTIEGKLNPNNTVRIKSVHK
jgi:hypothetical protein